MAIAILIPQGTNPGILPKPGIDPVYYTGPAWKPSPDPCRLTGYSLVIAPPSYKPTGKCKSRVTTVYPSLEALRDTLGILGVEAIAKDPESALYTTAFLLSLDYARLKRNMIASRVLPQKPPPLLIVADYYPGDLAGALRLYSEGADLVVVSASRSGWKNIVDGLLDQGIPVGVDAGLDTGKAAEAAEMGASMILSLTEDTLDEIPEKLRREPWWVIIPNRLSERPGERVDSLVSAARKASSLGFSRIILDPVAQPLLNPGFLASLQAAEALSKAGYPVMLGLNNVYELLDADTTGSIPVLVGLAYEAGVSMVLVSEVSDKARGAVLEASIASFMAYLAGRWNTTMKSLGIRLLLAKEKRIQA